MKSILAACLFSLGLAATADSTATLSLSWDGGPGAYPANRSRLAGTPATVVATATGFDQPVVAIQVVIQVASLYFGVPDSWRFEPGGCAEGGFQTPEAAIDPTFPFMTGANLRRISAAESMDGREKFTYAIAHDPVAVAFASRYTIAQFQFDMSAGFDGLGLKPDSCGCLDQPQGIRYVHASWVGADGQEYPFLFENECLGWEDPTNSVRCPQFGDCHMCGPYAPPPPHNPCADQQPTAAQPRSWGSIKGLYR